MLERKIASMRARSPLLEALGGEEGCRRLSAAFHARVKAPTTNWQPQPCHKKHMAQLQLLPGAEYHNFVTAGSQR